MKSHDLNRRDFVNVVLAFLGTIIGGVIGVPAVGYLLSPATKSQKSEAWVPAGPLQNYAEGVPTLFSFTRSAINGWEKTVNSFGVYILRTGESQVKALSNKCTHLSCRVNWKVEGQDYVCPCHDGHFNIEGKVISGPPPQPLHEYETKIEDGNLLIHVTEG